MATTPKHEYSAMKNPFFRKILPSGPETFFIHSPPINFVSEVLPFRKNYKPCRKFFACGERKIKISWSQKATN
jgi:hypothetical protein